MADITWAVGDKIEFGDTDHTCILSACCEIDTDKFVVVWRDLDDGDAGKARVGTRSGTVITWGAISEFYSSVAGSRTLGVCKLDTDRFVVVYAGSNGDGFARVGEVTDRTIAWGTAAEFETGDAEWLSCCLIDTDKFAIVYNDETAGDLGTACVCTVDDTPSANSVHPGTPVAFEGSIAYVSCAKLDTNKFLAFYKDAGDSNNPKACAFSVSDTIPTAGAILQIEVAAGEGAKCCQLDTNKAVLCYQDTSDDSGDAVIVTRDNDPVTDTLHAGTIVNFNPIKDWPFGSLFIGVAKLSDTEFAISFEDYGNSEYGTSTFCSFSGTTITPGTREIFSAAQVNYTDICLLSPGKVVAIYIDDADANDIGEAVIGEFASASAPTVTTQATTDKEDTTATGNGNITDTGGENCDHRGIVYGKTSRGDPGDTKYDATDYDDYEDEAGDFGTGAFTRSLTGLDPGTTYYARAYAHNSGGYSYGDEVSWLTKPAAATDVSATDGAHSGKVVVTWAKSTGATGYKVYEGENLLDTLGDVATYDDNAAPSGAISNAGTVSASDGDYNAHIELSLAGEAITNGASRTYKVVAFNGTGDADASGTDTGYTTPDTITYVWWRSNADGDAGYASIVGEGATTDPYDDDNAPESGEGRWYYCVVSSVGASNTPQPSDHDRGFRAAPPTVTTHVSDDIEDSTATGNGEIDAIGGENCTECGFVWSLNSHGDPGNVSPEVSDYENEQHNNGDFGVGVFNKGLTGLDTGDEIFIRAYAYNPTGGWDYGYEDSFLTKPAAPTNVAASSDDGTKVVITWTKSFGATDYHVFRGEDDLGPSGDVDTEDDIGATAGTITNAGTTTASDGTSEAHVVLSLASEATGITEHSYTVVASNATGDSDASGADNGNRSVGAITYQWQMSDADVDADYNTDIGTTDPYNATEAPANGDGRYFRCVVSSTDASNTPQTSGNDRGYRSSAGWTGIVCGVTNPAAVNGVAIAGISAVIGV